MTLSPLQRRFTPFLGANDYPQELIDHLLAHVPTPQIAQMDLAPSLRAIMASISLGLENKIHVLESLPLLMQWQCDALMEVWADEQREMSRVAMEEWPVISALCAQAWRNALLVCAHFGAPVGLQQANQWLSNMLWAKFALPRNRNRKWLDMAIAANPGPALCGTWPRAVPDLCRSTPTPWWLPTPETLQ